MGSDSRLGVETLRGHELVEPVEAPTGRGHRMTLLATAGALTEITRLREAPGAYDDTGRWVPGATTETTLVASVQPLGLTDAETAGGSQYRNRVKVFVPLLQVS